MAQVRTSVPFVHARSTVAAVATVVRARIARRAAGVDWAGTASIAATAVVARDGGSPASRCARTRSDRTASSVNDRFTPAR
jgi:hypothetical protein